MKSSLHGLVFKPKILLFKDKQGVQGNLLLKNSGVYQQSADNMTHVYTKVFRTFKLL